jgi:hypothetical protein
MALARNWHACIDLAPTEAVARCKLAAVLSKMPWHKVAYFLESFETLPLTCKLATVRRSPMSRFPLRHKAL